MVEVTLVLTILVIVTLIAVSRFGAAQADAEDTRARQTLELVRARAQEEALLNERLYPDASTLKSVLSGQRVTAVDADVASDGPQKVSVFVSDDHTDTVFVVRSESGNCWAVEDHVDDHPAWGGWRSGEYTECSAESVDLEAIDNLTWEEAVDAIN